jgi:hypothetical protein
MTLPDTPLANIQTGVANGDDGVGWQWRRWVLEHPHVYLLHLAKKDRWLFDIMQIDKRYCHFLVWLVVFFLGKDIRSP